ncbi:Concanavalin A-like lectin/glucanase, subgroup [Artemisia annua]|uniref:Concanavalin A-like lectin/glucanase, subgroup n=1 Tax=Artemisia annua TaxID=35608 RepID=A0A2U1LKP7_ARTAN|nr:Concanavalin A-like lectin/glucanase, subgroup [Artemisia annua]
MLDQSSSKVHIKLITARPSMLLLQYAACCYFFMNHCENFDVPKHIIGESTSSSTMSKKFLNQYLEKNLFGCQKLRVSIQERRPSGIPVSFKKTYLLADKSTTTFAFGVNKEVLKDGASTHIAAHILTFRELAAGAENFRPDCLLGGRRLDERGMRQKPSYDCITGLCHRAAEKEGKKSSKIYILFTVEILKRFIIWGCLSFVLIHTLNNKC